MTALPPSVKRWAASVLGLAVVGCAALMVAQRPTGPETTSLRIEDGDSIARLFARAGLGDGALLAIMEANRGTAFGLALVPGEEVRINRREDGSLDTLIVGNGEGETTAFIVDEGDRFAVALPGPPARTARASHRESPPGHLTGRDQGELPRDRRGPTRGLSSR